MTLVRRHLRAWTAAWLLCQAAATIAFAEPFCCLTHQPGEAAHAGHGADPVPHCDTPGVPADRFPMRSTTGEACPMHRAQQAVQEAAADPFHSGDSVLNHPAPPAPPALPAQGECAIRATCTGETVVIATLLPMPAVLTDAPLHTIAPGVSPVAVAGDRLPKVLVSSDTPPPRA